jgi:hypothetical protein
MKGTRKYLSEFALNLFSGRWLMIPASQLASGGEMGEAEQEVADASHIYLICQHPALSYSAKGFLYKDEYIEGQITYEVEGQARTLPFRRHFPLLDGASKLALSPYPHREVRTFDNTGNIVRYFPASALCFASHMHGGHEELGAFEVLYVGQAFGDGKRSAFERLQSHSTLQKILAEAQYQAPNKEILLFLFEYVPYRVINQMDGRNKEAIADKTDSARFYSILENPLTAHQQICLAEAALIRYFAPHYNEIYKETFPSDSHKILEQCYALDFSALVVEINTDELDFRLYSRNVEPKWHHISQIDLFDPDVRKGFFHYPKGDGSYWSVPNVIKPTSGG